MFFIKEEYYWTQQLDTIIHVYSFFFIVDLFLYVHKIIIHLANGADATSDCFR